MRRDLKSGDLVISSRYNSKYKLNNKMPEMMLIEFEHAGPFLLKMRLINMGLFEVNMRLSEVNKRLSKF